MRSWASNDKQLQELAASQNVLDKDQLIKILGIRWNTSEDTISFAKTKLIHIDEKHITKREVPKKSSRIYDPHGFISPVTVCSKMFLQTFWENKLVWDEILPSELTTAWLEIAHAIQEATEIVINRHYFEDCSDGKEDTVVHVFTDASMRAYGACAYLVSDIHSSLIMAKNRVAPIKHQTIPRLELMATVIGSRLLQHILQNTTVSVMER